MLLPVMCVRTNRIISLSRSESQRTVGFGGYDGRASSAQQPIATNWPASVLGISGSGISTAGLPGDTAVPYWTVLLPISLGIAISRSDLIADDLGRNAVVISSESTSLGWRLTAKQATV